jgi:hypothetical protein
MDTQTLLKSIGGQSVIARECDITDSAVSQWAADDEIPGARRKYLQLAHPGPHWISYESHIKAKPPKPKADKSVSHA